jgi:hypothetical protein
MVFVGGVMRKLILILGVILLSSCASHYAPEVLADPYGFFSGLWHGMISPITITVNVISWLLSVIGISLLTDIQIIGRPNTGFGYYAGFFIGFMFLSAR